MIRAKFSVRNVLREMEEHRKRVNAVIIRNMRYVGLHAITIAREQHARNYTDRTGNLRASVGAVIAKDGEIIGTMGFDPAAAGNPTDGKTGAADGRKFAAQIAAEVAGKYPGKTVLIVVAGMYYGAYVEKRNYNVITFTKMEAEQKAEELMRGAFG
jgi:hypothetical protein